MTENIEIKDCPFCGSDLVFLTNYGQYDCFYEIRCKICTARGPSRYNGKDALKFWNMREND